MADAVTAQWHGHNYQSRVFWDNALNLLDPTACVVEVTFEADGPKAFDDVVVRYDPPIAGAGAERVSAEYQQVKWHVHSGGRFGYQDFIDPDFIGAQSFSLLQRLRDACLTAPAGSRFAFVTVYRTRDDDPLAVLVSGNDKSLLVDKLFDGTTDRSRMGKVRKLWREHLGLTTDAKLKNILSRFRIIEGHRSLEELRLQINLKARTVGLLACEATNSEFRYDELARQLKVRKLNQFTRESLNRMCREENLLAASSPVSDSSLPIAIRSFAGSTADITGALPENALSLTGEFRQRYLQVGRDWQTDIRPMVEGFLNAAVAKSSRLRLALDAHASIAFLAGAVLDLKSGVDVTLVQKGRVGTRTWRVDDETTGPRLDVRAASLGSGSEVVVCIGIAQAVDVQARNYVSTNLPNAGDMLTFAFPNGPSAQGVAGGAHAVILAEQIAHEVRAVRAVDPDAPAHIFAACPNALLFFLGQNHRTIAPCIIYEFDFDRKGDKSYQPSFIID